MTRSATVAALVALAAGGLVACGDDSSESIDSGRAQPTVETTTTAAPADQGDGNGDEGDDDDGDDDVATSSVDCADDDNPSVGGSGEAVAIVGSCDGVGVSGNGHLVSIESAEAVEVSGHGHRVAVRDADLIEISGSDHDVRHPPDAEIDNTSSNSHVAVLDDETRDTDDDDGNDDDDDD